MLNAVFSWFERRYPATALADDREPPAGLVQFYRYFLKQFRGGIGAKMVTTALGSSLDAMLPIYLGIIVDLVTNSERGQIFSEHGWLLALIGFLVFARPLTWVVDVLIHFHAITPSLVDRVRWQSHYHVIRQSWSFF